MPMIGWDLMYLISKRLAYHRISYTAPREDLPGPDGCDDDEIDVIFQLSLIDQNPFKMP